MCLSFKGSEPILKGHIDAAMAGDLYGRKYTQVLVLQGSCILAVQIAKMCYLIYNGG